MSIHDEVRELRRRVANLEAAADLKGLLGETGDEQVMNEICAQMRLGLAQVQSSSREPTVTRCRSFLATNLHQRMGWTVQRIARAMKKHPRAVRKMIARAS